MLLLCLKILSISLQSLNARNYLRRLHKPCHSVRRLKNEHRMHNSCIKIFNALPVAAVLSSNGLLITSSLRQLKLRNWFISTNKITTWITGRRLQLCNIHSAKTLTERRWHLHTAECLNWTRFGRNTILSAFFYSKDILSADLDWIFYITSEIYRVDFFPYYFWKINRLNWKLRKR